LFYDEFYNILKSFDDDTYLTQEKKYAFTSIYDDYTFGGNTVISNLIPNKNSLNFSLHYKNDFHSEYNLGEPLREFNDLTLSTGLDEEFYVNKKTTLKAGIGYSVRKGLKADNFDPGTGDIQSFPLKTSDALNLQIGSDFILNRNNNLSIYVSRRTRFATLKDRYSYRLGRSIPNPGLTSEEAIHTDLTYKTSYEKKY
jgi:iron complex outermembrane receptor protein